MLKILILLPYFNRPNMVRYALRSVMRADRLHTAWTLAFIDDGSVKPGRPVVEEFCASVLNRVVFYDTGDDAETKHNHKESRYGQFMNQAIRENEADICFMLCDDDAVLDDYMVNLNSWFLSHPEQQHCYSHIWPFNPFVSDPWSTPYTQHCLNRHTAPIECCCNVDASQVAWRRDLHSQHNIWFPERQTRDLDANFYSQLNKASGLTPFSGHIGQYKGFHEQQLGRRAVDIDSNWRRDIDLPTEKLRSV